MVQFNPISYPWVQSLATIMVQVNDSPDDHLPYNPWKHVGFGLGFDLLSVQLDADGEDWPGIDFDGSVSFDYAGLQLYLRLFY